MNVVNVIATGDLGIELDLEALYNDLEEVNVKYEPEKFSALQVRFDQEGPVIMLFSSGSYNIVGVKEISNIENIYDSLKRTLENKGISCENEESTPEVQNIICKEDLGGEIKLEILPATLGLENTEYEPEQSPFVYYWPEEDDCLITIPHSGECMITGIRTVDEAEKAFYNFKQKAQPIIQLG
jgi:transcription initiation factor TFIID TATA-box-binding protein